LAKDRVDIDAALVRKLVASQFPHWAPLTIRPVADSGWDNRIFRLGSEMLVRIPSAAHYSAQVQKEQRWLPYLAPCLPLPIPAPLAMGEPGPDFPWPWSIYRWLDGETANHQRIHDHSAFAAQLARFLNALRQVDTNSAPAPGAHNFHRGADLIVYDDEARAAVTTLGRAIDGPPVLHAWEAALGSRWWRLPVWVHGDVAPGNLLVRDGELSAVIDFGNCAVGDPACDLAIAWTFFDEPARRSFKARIEADEDTWLRAAGWALWKALIVLARAPDTDSEAGQLSRRTIEAVIADVSS
jgi:aminoglycoside phosphotransferase (APT) family kinase protein